MVEDQDRALLDGEPSEGTLEQIAVVDCLVLVGPVRGSTGRSRMPSDQRVRRLASE